MANAKSAPPHRKAAISSFDPVLISITFKVSILNTQAMRERMKNESISPTRRG